MRVLAALRRHALSCQRNDVNSAVTTTEEPDTDEILKQLYAEDRRAEPSRHGGDLIHASHLIHNHKCARMLFLANYMVGEGVTFSEAPFGAMKLVWALGRAAEKHARTNLLKNPSIRARAFGMWRCRCRATEARGHLPTPPQRCTRCGTLADRYDEVTLADDDAGIMGNPDMLLKQGTRYTVIEIKSIKTKSTSAHDGFDSIEAPQPKHVEQGFSYVKLGERNGLYMHEKPVTLYVAKDFDPKKWYKALLPSPQLLGQVKEDVATSRAAAKEYRIARQAADAEPERRDEFTPPKIEKCATNANACKKSCPVWAECYAHD